MVDLERAPRADPGTRHARLLIAAGICAAVHVGKLPPALDVLRVEFGLGLGEAGLLLSMIQIAGMTAGVLFGAWIDVIGSSRSMRSGLVLLALASVAGAFSQTATALLAWRAVEGVGFLLTVLAAPPWIRALVVASRLQRLMGMWGIYMPLGIALALAIGPAWITVWGWRGWWVAVGVATAVTAIIVTWRVPADRLPDRAPDRAPNRFSNAPALPAHADGHTSAVDRRATGLSAAPRTEGARGPDGSRAPPRDRGTPGSGHAMASPPKDDGAPTPLSPMAPRARFDLTARLRETLGHRGPWLVALCFAVYSSQWLAVVGFLPSMYAQLGITATTAGILTAIVSLANAGGNMLGATLLHRGHRATRLIAAGFTVMAAGSFAAYVHIDGAPFASALHGPLPMEVRYAAVLAFSLVGGLVPASLFALSARVAPSDRTLGSTVGWMQQWSAFGQFVGPPLAGWLAGVMGGWQFTWVATMALSAAGLVLAALTARHPRVRAAGIGAGR